MADKTPKKRTDRKAASAPATARGVQKPYVVLARKYRPKGFEDLIGQDALVVTLKNAFSTGRIAQAYMLTGVRGVGKTTTARILARALNFARDGVVDGATTDLPVDPDQYGLHCAEIMESRHVDVIEMDAASNTGVDNIREIIESARYKPLVARYKVFIIDEVHMLSKGAFNALLKTLEEPPEHVKFIFATTEIRKVPVTVLSRCQRFDLRRVDVSELAAHFKAIVKSEGAKAQDDALRLIARAAEGSVRDGLSILDQAIAFQQGDVREDGVRSMLGLADRGRVFDLLEFILGGRIKDVLASLNSLYRDGCEPVRVLFDVGEVVHLVTRTKVLGNEPGLEGISAEEQRRAIGLGENVSLPLLARAWQMLLKGIDETGRSSTPLAAAEMVLIRMTFAADLPTPDELIKTLGGGSVSKRAAKPSKSQSEGETTAVGAGETFLAEPQAKSSAFEERGQAGEVLSPHGAGTVGEHSAGGSPVPGETSGRHLNLASFEDVIALVGEKRDARLKVHLEEYVSLVKFDAQSQAIDLHLLAGAPGSIANELRERLVEWTRSRWIVMLSNTAGAVSVAQRRREELDAEVARLKTEPFVKAALEAFPDAKIVEISPLTAAAADADADEDPEADTA